MTICAATIIVPTTGDRGELLRFSIASIQAQTMQDFEIQIVGDGVTNAAKDVIAELIKQDSRISFHDFPKHARRGEPNRHQVIKESKGKNIFYLTDRDLMLPYHLEYVTSLLGEYNIASTTFIDVKKDQSLNIDQNVSYFGPASQVEVSKRWAGCLSCVGHTRAMYDKLPFGWRTTPADEYTDIYMWKQFVAHPECNMFSAVRPTILYFKRGHFPGDPVEQRVKELAFWTKIIATPGGVENVASTALASVLMERRTLKSFRDSVITQRLATKI